MKFSNLLDIMNLIQNHVEESLHLEYKASGALEITSSKKQEISKDVSAFANSDGGIIIYGIKEYLDKSEKHLPEKIDPIERTQISKEWLEQVINSSITPRISGLTITPIPVDEANKKVIYVVEIPKSYTAHQAIDFRYYRRFNFETVPMYDYEIRDILNRIKYPIISLEFKIIKKTYEEKILVDEKTKTTHVDYLKLLGSIPSKSNLKKEIKTKYFLRVWAHNKGKVLAKYIDVSLEIPYEFIKYNTHIKSDSDNVKFSFNNTVRDEVDSKFTSAGIGSGGSIQYSYGPSRYVPILPTRYFHLEDIPLNECFMSTNKELKWVAYSDNADSQSGTISVSEIIVTDENLC